MGVKPSCIVVLLGLPTASLAFNTADRKIARCSHLPASALDARVSFGVYSYQMTTSKSSTFDCASRSRSRCFAKEDLTYDEEVTGDNEIQVPGSTENNNGHVRSRRSVLHTASLSFAGTVSSGPLAALLRSFGDGPVANNNERKRRVNHNRNVANAMGLVQFPCPPGTLMNTYHLMRAGESGYEAQDILITNPLFLTNREDALTDLGMAQVEEACKQMVTNGVNPSVIKYSLAAKCIDTVNIIATTMLVGRNRIVPEFTFMDQRQAGLWDGKPLHSIEPALFALDATEAGKEGRDGRPPANEDGTANETLFDQVIRLRQLMSILETQYSGDDIVLVFPDGGSPALLSCLIAGIPLNKCHALNFLPGEIRLNVNMENSLQLIEEKITSQQYNDALSIGNEQLIALRNPPAEEVQEVVVGSPPVKTKDSSELRQKRQTELAKALATGDNKEMSEIPDIFSVGAMGAIGGMAMWNGGKEKEDNEEESQLLEKSSAPTLAFANATGTGTSLFEPSTFATANLATTSTPARETVASIPKNVVEKDIGFLNPNVFQDVPVQTKEERIEAANKAMEEYLNQDDGGDAWLSAMSEIMNEE